MLCIPPAPDLPATDTSTHKKMAQAGTTMMQTGTDMNGIQTQKGSNERLFILTRTHSIHIFGEIPFIKPQNDT